MRNLLARGARREAVQLYMTAAQVNQAEAEGAVDGLAENLAAKILLRQQLTPLGFGLLAIFSLGLVASLVAGFTGYLRWWLAGLLALACVFQLSPYLSALRTELRLRGASRAPALILNFAPIGRLKYVHVFRAWLEIRPLAEPPFRAEIDLTVRQQNLSLMRAGEWIQVLYKPGDPLLVVYDGRAANPTTPA